MGASRYLCIANLQALRTPFVITNSPSTLPPNTSGWQKPDNSIDLPHIGSVDLNLPLSFIHLYAPSKAELKQIKRVCLYHHRHSKHQPWRHVFFLNSSQVPAFSRFATRSPTPYRKICSFSWNTTSYMCYASDNHLSRTIDPIVHPSLSRWLSNFTSTSIHATPHSHHCRRPIHPLLPDLPLAPITCAQPYFSHLNLPIHRTSQPLSSLLLCGVLIRPRLCKHTLNFLRQRK